MYDFAPCPSCPDQGLCVGRGGCDRVRRAHAKEMAQRIKREVDDKMDVKKARHEASEQKAGLMDDIGKLLEESTPAAKRLVALQAKDTLTVGELRELDLLLGLRWTHNPKAS